MLTTNITITMVPRASRSSPGYQEKKETNVLLVLFPLEKVKILFLNPKWICPCGTF